MSNKDQISRETAEEQLELLLDYYEIELEKRMRIDDADKAQAQADAIRDILIRAIQRGRLEITEDEDSTHGGIKIVQTLRRPVGGTSQIRYYEVTGRARTQLKDLEKGSPHEKVYTLLSAISKEPKGVFLGMGGVDLTTAETLSTVFTMV